MRCGCEAAFPTETANFAYLRFHGTQRWYHRDYSTAALCACAERIRGLKARTVDIHFNNDVNAPAAYNARELTRLLEP